METKNVMTAPSSARSHRPAAHASPRIILPPLPFPVDALAPAISAQTLDTHYDKHHAAYVAKTNELLAKGGESYRSYLDLLSRAGEDLFRQAAQAWSHAFYWHSLLPENESAIERASLNPALRERVDAVEDDFIAKAEKHFGAGWCWLLQAPDGSIHAETSPDAELPFLGNGATPLAVCDVWEHAYYLDYKNDRPAYARAFWRSIRWSFVEENSIERRFDDLGLFRAAGGPET